jgi:hypothetical protein
VVRGFAWDGAKRMARNVLDGRISLGSDGGFGGPERHLPEKPLDQQCLDVLERVKDTFSECRSITEPRLAYRRGRISPLPTGWKYRDIPSLALTVSEIWIASPLTAMLSNGVLDLGVCVVNLDSRYG